MLQWVCSTIVALRITSIAGNIHNQSNHWDADRIHKRRGQSGILDIALYLMSDLRTGYPFYDENRLPAMPGYELRDTDGAVEAWQTERREEPEEVYREDVAEALRFVVNWLLGCKTASTIGGRALLLGQLIGIDHALE